MKRSLEADIVDDAGEPSLPSELLHCEILPKCDSLTRRLFLFVSRACCAAALPLTSRRHFETRNVLIAHGTQRQIELYADLVPPSRENVKCAISSGNTGAVAAMFLGTEETAKVGNFCSYMMDVVFHANSEVLQWFFDHMECFRDACQNDPFSTVSKLAGRCLPPPTTFIASLIRGSLAVFSAQSVALAIEVTPHAARSCDGEESALALHVLLFSLTGPLPPRQTLELLRKVVKASDGCLALIDMYDPEAICSRRALFDVALQNGNYEAVAWLWQHPALRGHKICSDKLERAVVESDDAPDSALRLAVWAARNGANMDLLLRRLLEYHRGNGPFLYSRVLVALDAAYGDKYGVLPLKELAITSVEMGRLVVKRGIAVTRDLLIRSFKYLTTPLLAWFCEQLPDAAAALLPEHYFFLPRRAGPIVWFLKNFPGGVPPQSWIKKHVAEAFVMDDLLLNGDTIIEVFDDFHSIGWDFPYAARCLAAADYEQDYNAMDHILTHMKGRNIACDIKRDRVYVSPYITRQFARLKAKHGGDV